MNSINRLTSQSGTLSEELELKDIAIKSLEIEEVYKETLHLLVFLFMHFLSYPNQTKIPENKTSFQRCFHCMFSLIGYDEVQQRFTTMPHKIRFYYLYNLQLNLLQTYYSGGQGPE